jgi:hypothetical protein
MGQGLEDPFPSKVEAHAPRQMEPSQGRSESATTHVVAEALPHPPTTAGDRFGYTGSI